MLLYKIIKLNIAYNYFKIFRLMFIYSVEYIISHFITLKYIRKHIDFI